MRYLLLALCLLLTACTQPQDGAIRMGLASAPTNLDPRFATDATSSRINRLIYRHLVDFDADSRPIPGIATWERVTPTHYRFTLGADGRTFHDGSRLTAADVATTYRFILDPANASPHRGSLTLIERIETADEDLIDFHLGRPDPLFPAYLVIGICPAAAIAAKHPLHQAPLGSGPARLLDWPEEGRVRLKRIADDQVIELVRVADPNVRVLKLLRGEIDLLQNDLPPELVGYLEGREGTRIERRPGTNFTYLGFNLEDTATGSPLVRRAIALAIDREAIIRHVLQGGARPAAALLPPEHWAGARDLQPIAYDPTAARALLGQAGYGPDRPLHLVYKTSSDPFRIRLATILQHQLTQVGIEVELKSYDWGTFYGDIKAGRFQLYSLSWVGIRTPDIFRYAFHSASLPPAGANRGRLRDAVVDGLIERAEALDGLEEQATAYREVQARLSEVLPYAPLWYEEQMVAIRAGVEGYELAADGNFDGLIKVRRAALPMPP